MEKIVAWAKQHPAPAGIVVVGAVIALAWLFGFFGKSAGSSGGASTAGDQSLVGAYYAAEAANTQANTAAQIAQTNANAAVDISQIQATGAVDLSTAQGATQQALANTYSTLQQNLGNQQLQGHISDNQTSAINLVQAGYNAFYTQAWPTYALGTESLAAGNASTNAQFQGFQEGVSAVLGSGAAGYTNTYGTVIPAEPGASGYLPVQTSSAVPYAYAQSVPASTGYNLTPLAPASFNQQVAYTPAYVIPPGYAKVA